jgi:predicted metalloprotease with PDZ domain
MAARSIARCILASALLCCGVPLRAPAAEPIAVTLKVDAREATRGILHVSEAIPNAQGEVKLVYPKWLPGGHSPEGPIANLSTLVPTSGGERLAWRRDPVDFYTFYVTVPAGKRGLDLTYDFLGADRLATPNILTLDWFYVTLTPFAEHYRDVIVTPSVQLPSPDWAYATALEPGARSNTPRGLVEFAPVTLEMLIDSPLDAGLNSSRIALGSIAGAPVDIAIFADTPEQLAIGDARLAKLKNLVREMGALYGARHFNHYTFLLTVSDQMPGSGLEHHQSSDDGVRGNALTGDEEFRINQGDLLGHEFNHSWDGKYRRPYNLATPNLQVPMQDDLLWVYEGMTQFYGQLQTTRAGIWTTHQWLDGLAATYAEFDYRTGRHTRPLVDTALAAPISYGGSAKFGNMRRYADYYSESNLMWLLADVIIIKQSGGKKAIDDVARAFFGRSNTGPEVVTYTRKDLIEAFNAVQPYDWAGFFTGYVDTITDHPPRPFEAGGWQFTYAAKPSEIDRQRRELRERFSVWYSLGFQGAYSGVISDVVAGSPAALAGMAPGMKLIGIDGRTFDTAAPQAQLDTALEAARTRGGIRLLVTFGGTYREFTIDYRGGPRYPRLERIAGTPDLLSAIAAPRAAGQK